MQGMTKLLFILSIVLPFGTATQAQSADPSAKPSQAILKGLPDAAYVDVTLGKEFPTITGVPTGSLFSIDKDGNEIEVAPLPDTIAPPYRSFSIKFPAAGAMQYNPDLSYEVLILVPSVDEKSNPIKRKKSLKVTG